jgi:23S rRNA pseudouridine1911/1915/1917 synthase
MMGMTTTKTIKCETGGERLDVFLAANMSGVSRSAAQKLIEAERVTLVQALGGIFLRKNYITNAGDEYVVLIDEPADSAAKPQDIPLDVVFEDSDVIVINKPQGMVVHPAPGHTDGTLVNALLAHCGDSLSGIGGEKRPGIVHRIDKMTSGLIIAAKNDFAHISLTKQLAERTLLREYTAIVHGRIKTDSKTIDAPIGRHHIDRKRQAVTDKNSRSAVTHIEVVTVYDKFTHIRCRLETGRTHQIRVHLAHIGHPVVGDVVYGRKKTEFGLLGQALHAQRLEFSHPRSGETVRLEAELPGYFAEVLGKLHIRNS